MQQRLQLRLTPYCHIGSTHLALTPQEKRQSSAEAVAGRQAAMLRQIAELEAADSKRRDLDEMMSQAWA